MITCALCGFKYDEAAAACGGCPLVIDCALVKCPNCGYETPVRESRFVGWMGDIWKQLQKPKGDQRANARSD